MAILKSFLAIAALFVMLMAACIGYYIYADQRAASAAHRFCDAVVIGSAVSGVATQAQAAGARYLSGGTSDLHKVFFQGPPFNGYYCDLNVTGGTVVSRQVTKAED